MAGGTGWGIGRAGVARRRAGRSASWRRCADRDWRGMVENPVKIRDPSGRRRCGRLEGAIRAGREDSWQKTRRCVGVGSCWCAASWRRRCGWESMKNGGGDTAVGRRLSCARGSQERKGDAIQQYTRTKTKEIGVRQQEMMDMSKSIHHQHLHPFAVESV